MNPAQTNYICINFKIRSSTKFQRHAQRLVSAFTNSWHCYTETKAEKLNTESSKENSTKVNENNNMVRNYG